MSKLAEEIEGLIPLTEDVSFTAARGAADRLMQKFRPTYKDRSALLRALAKSVYKDPILMDWFASRLAKNGGNRKAIDYEVVRDIFGEPIAQWRDQRFSADRITGSDGFTLLYGKEPLSMDPRLATLINIRAQKHQMTGAQAAHGIDWKTVDNLVSMIQNDVRQAREGDAAAVGKVRTLAKRLVKAVK